MKGVKLVRGFKKNGVKNGGKRSLGVLVLQSVCAPYYLSCCVPHGVVLKYGSSVLIVCTTRLDAAPQNLQQACLCSQ